MNPVLATTLNSLRRAAVTTAPAGSAGTLSVARVVSVVPSLAKLLPGKVELAICGTGAHVAASPWPLGTVPPWQMAYVEAPTTGLVGVAGQVVSCHSS